MNNAYFLRNRQTKTLMGISTFSNHNGEFCNDVGARFEPSEDTSLYCVSSYGVAREALSRDPHWYNSSIERPQWYEGFDPAQWEIVSVTV